MSQFLPDYMLFGAGLALLLASAELLVRNATRLAGLLGKSSLFVGLTVTAFGTSAPELAVGISGQLSHNADIGLGNIVGSNIFNILFVLGLGAVVRPIVIRKPTIWRDVPLLLGVSVLFYLLTRDGYIGHVESIVLILLLAGYLYYLSRVSGESSQLAGGDHPLDDSAPRPRRLSLRIPIMVVISIALMIVASRWMVTGAVSLAGALGLSELVIGLTIVAVGTSLPEIATTVAAIRHGEHELAVGNIIGSCFFNIIAIPAAMSLVDPAALSVSRAAIAVDLPVMILAVVACLPIFFSGHLISRPEGVLFLLYYFGYAALLYLRSSPDTALGQLGSRLGLLALPVVAVTLATVTYRALRERRPVEKEL